MSNFVRLWKIALASLLVAVTLFDVAITYVRNSDRCLINIGDILIQHHGIVNISWCIHIGDFSKIHIGDIIFMQLFFAALIAIMIRPERVEHSWNYGTGFDFGSVLYTRFVMIVSLIGFTIVTLLLPVIGVACLVS